MTKHTHRREFLRAATATVAAAGLAGCTGGDDDEMDGTTTESMDDEMSTESMDDSTDAMGDDGMTEESMDDGTDSMDDSMDDDSTSEDDSMGDGDGMGERETFTVTVTNVSEEGTLSAGGEDLAVPLSPGAYAVHPEDVAAFEPGEDAPTGLESLAEDGMPGAFAEELDGTDGVHAGAFDTPDMADEAGPLHPGESYSFEVEAGHGERLTLATMFAQSNDLFFAPEPEGIALFEDDERVEGDVTDEIVLWDAGTEANEEPGTGPNQAPRQDGADTGEDEMASLRRIEDVDDMYDYPDVSDVIEVAIGGM